MTVSFREITAYVVVWKGGQKARDLTTMSLHVSFPI